MVYSNVLKSKKMIPLIRAYKTELHPTPAQANKIRQTLGVCRFVYNLYISENQKSHEQQKGFITAFDFSKWLNNIFLPNNPEYSWIKSVSSKAVAKSIQNGETAFKRFFKHQAKFPCYKKKSKTDRVKAYFPRNSKTDWIAERHRIKIPTLGYIRLKEKGYIPENSIIRSGTVSLKAGRYFVSILIDIPECPKESLNTTGLGIDLGIKTFATCSNNMIFSNINKSAKIKKLEKKLRREQRRFSRKLKNHKKGESARNITKQNLKIQKLYYRLACIRQDYLHKCVNELVKTKPAYIAIEDLNVAGMLKNRHLIKAIKDLGFSMFRTMLISKCEYCHIPVRLINRWYPSSKTCHFCGYVKKDLKLSEREYDCPNCHSHIDRDYQAALNIRDCTDYKYVC